MSFEAVGWALRTAPAKGNAQVVLIALAERAGGDFGPFEAAFPSHQTLAQEAQVSASTVKRVLRDLEERGVIRRGNQNIPQVLGFRPDRRPVVWNLNQYATRHEAKSTGGQNEPPLKPAETVAQNGANGGSNEETRGVKNESTGGHSYDLQTSLNPPTLNLPKKTMGENQDFAPVETSAGESDALLPAVAEAPKAPSKKGSRMFHGWYPSKDTIAKMQAEFPDMNFQAVHDVFTDYWVAVPGQKGLKLDWEATWRNWVRREGNGNAYPRIYPQGVVSTPQQPSKADLKASWYVQRGQELAEQYKTKNGGQ